jgi:hypothetical protein
VIYLHNNYSLAYNFSHTDTNSSANVSSTNLVTESDSHVNVDDETRSRLSKVDLAEDVDCHPPHTSSEGEGEDNETADDPYPTHDSRSSEPQGTGTQPAAPSQANVETEKSDCNLTTASLESNPKAIHDAEVDIEDEDPVLDDKSSEHKVDRTPPPEAACEVGSGSKLIERPIKDPLLPEKISEYEAERGPSPAAASQQHRSESPTHHLREIQSFLSNISDVQLSSDSTASIGTPD